MSLRLRLLDEIREIGVVSLYFFACYAVFLILKKLLLEQYHVSLYVFHAAIIGALVTAKVVVILEKTSFGSRFQGSRLAYHVIWRTLAYTGIVFIVTLAEQILDVYLDHGSVQAALRNLWSGKDFDHYLALNMSVGLSFLVYNTVSELDRRLGRGTVRRLLLSKATAADGAPLVDTAKQDVGRASEA
jgi:hypothetical protein